MGNFVYVDLSPFQEGLCFMEIACILVVFNTYGAIVELSLTLLDALPGPISRSNQDVILKCFILGFS